MRSNNSKLSTAMERLSTGLRINSAKDDAAGLAISNRMTAQIRGMSMAIKNANDGISMAQTADGAYGQVTSMLQRMRELAVQAANGAVSGSDRESIQLEIEELKAEINNVAERTNFNGIKLLDGSAQDIKLQTGTNEGELMSVGFSSVKAKDIGSGEAPALTSVGGTVSTKAALAAGDLVINGVMVNASLATDDSLSISTNAAASSIAKAAAINRVSDLSGVFARVNATIVGGVSMSASATATSGKITINGVDTASITTGTDLESNRVLVAKAINDISAQTGVRAVNTGDDRLGVTLVADDGRNITVGTLKHLGTSIGINAAATYVGTYSLYSRDGGDITIDHEVGKLAGDFDNAGLQLGTFSSNVATMSTQDRKISLGTAAASAAYGVLSGDTLKINGIAISAARATDDNASVANTSSSKASSAIAIAAAINRSSGETGVTAKAAANVLRGTGWSTSGGTTVALTLNGVAINLDTTARSNIVDAINAKTGETGVVARDHGTGLELRAEDGRNISISFSTDTASVTELGLGGLVGLGGTNLQTVTVGSNTFYSEVVLSSDRAFSVERGNEASSVAGDSNFHRLGFREGTFGGDYTGMKVDEVDVTTQLGASAAITAIDNAISDVSAAQARSGAFQNRLDAVVSVLGESSENASAARSRILDTDYAQETTALAKAQIVQQAATAMLAQANQQQQSVLALLQ
jgi:flagellin